MKARALPIVGVLSLSVPWLAGCNGPSPVEWPSDWPISQVPPASRAQPPPISGGTLLVLLDGHTAVAADPDLDRVWFVDLLGGTVVGSAAFQTGDEPGRVVQGGGRVHVVLRGGGAVATIDPSNASVLRRAVCAAPRGLAYDVSLDAIHVACVDGALVTLPAAGGDATRTVLLDEDLRDVVVQDGTIYVSRFRSAELLEVAPDGTIAQRITPPQATGSSITTPGVAYRTVGLPGGGLAMLHQRASVDPLATMSAGPMPGAVPPPYYGGSGGCPGVGIVQDTITVITPGTAPSVSPPLGVTLGVDLAVSTDGGQIGVAAASGLGPTVTALAVPSLTAPPGATPTCPGGPPSPIPSTASLSGAQAVAVAFDGLNRLVAQTRAPSAIVVDGTPIPLSAASTHNPGQDVFYMPTASGITCASCHPEGGDDGRVWQFTGLGPRRTQNLRGGVLARAPFHWSGDIADMDALVNVVFVERMAGPTLTAQQTADLGSWMDAQPALAAPAPLDPAAVARGKATFEDPNVGCTGCHSGPQLSTHALVDVGTGGTFKVPSLIAVRYRAPYLHDGCAATLLDRFGPNCGGGDQHGHTSQLDAGQLSDLVAFLESL